MTQLKIMLEKIICEDYKLQRALNRLETVGVVHDYLNKQLKHLILSLVMMLWISIFLKDVAKWYLMMIAIGVVFYPRFQILNLSNEVYMCILQRLPTMILEMSLLIQTGMPLGKVIERLSQQTYLTNLLLQAESEVRLGHAKSKVYTKVYMGLDIAEVTRWLRILVLDEKNGSKETIQSLERLRVELWKQKKSLCLKRSEKISTQLLLPMMMALLGVLCAIIVPAIFELFTVMS